MANPIDTPLPPPVNRTKGRVTVETGSIPAGAVRERASDRREDPQPPRTIDEQRAMALGPAPVGSKDYVAGQPVDEEEYRRTEAEAKAKQLPPNTEDWDAV